MGIQSESIVGIEMYSSYEFVLCMLAILKAGGAFLPIDKYLPETRKEYIVRNSKMQYLIHKDVEYDNNYADIVGLYYDKSD